MIKDIVFYSLYFLIIINPFSKIIVISSLSETFGHKEVRLLSIKSSFIALLLLAAFAIAGNFVLSHIFNLELYSIRIAGGFIYFFMGMKALDKGVFFEMEAKKKLQDLSIVPIASPMIAGPAAIAAAIQFTTEYGQIKTLITITIAVFINLLFMLFTQFLTKYFFRQNIIGAFVRITGLLIAAIAVQMILAGLASWMRSIGLV